MEQTELGQDEIEVVPTKALFVDILTKDIALDRAIIDLVDNCIDGARRLRPGDDSSYAGLEVMIELDENRFRIRDNCGGISVEIARKYAFRFGRARGFEGTPGSIGQFGVGMKRALFKFGHRFEVDSATSSERFRINVNVDEWLAKDNEWRFKFDHIENGLAIPEAQTGTDIRVPILRSSVAQTFGLETFRNALKREIQSAEQQAIDRGMRIMVCGQTLLPTAWELMRGDELTPARVEHVIEIADKQPIFVRIFAGLGTSSPSEAGWYIFCNGRLVLEADQSDSTGWNSIDGTRQVTLPKYHNQFARFRGYVFFDSEDASLLPWNTTKSGVDSDSPIYRTVLAQMADTMRAVIDFLNDLDAEKELPDDARTLESTLRKATPVRLPAISRVGPFTYAPREPREARPQETNISYRRPKEQVEAIQQAMGARSNKDVGERTFDFAYKKIVEEK